VKTEDGTAIPDPIQVYIDITTDTGSFSDSLKEEDIVKKGPSGQLTLRIKSSLKFKRVESAMIHVKGYVPVKQGGALPNRWGTIKMSPVTIERDYHGVLCFVNQQGQPVPQVKILNVMDTYERSQITRYDHNFSLTSNDRGSYKINNAGGRPIRISIRPPAGYAEEDKTLRFTPNQTVEWTLQPAHTFQGTIVDAYNKPVPGAKIHFLQTKKGSSSRDHRGSVISDSNGHFIFSAIAANEPYILEIESEGYFTRYFKQKNISHSGDHFQLNTGGSLTVHFENTNLLNPPLKVSQSYTHNFADGGSITSSRPESTISLLSQTENSATYLLSNIWEGENKLSLNGLSHAYIAPFTTNSLVLDIAEMQSRADDIPEPIQKKVTIRLVSPLNEPIPSGVLSVVVSQGKNNQHTETFSIPPSGIIREKLLMNPDSPITLLAHDIPGYIIHERHPSSETPIDIACSIQPAGSVILSFIDEQGDPVTGYKVYIYTKETSHHLTGGSYDQIKATETLQGTCVIHGLDFQNQFRIRTSKWYHFEDHKFISAKTDWFSVSETNPVKKITCVLKPEE
jgi:hypothetical protein